MVGVEIGDRSQSTEQQQWQDVALERRSLRLVRRPIWGGPAGPLGLGSSFSHNSHDIGHHVSGKTGSTLRDVVDDGLETGPSRIVAPPDLLFMPGKPASRP